jgi:hypothetical protein
MNDRELLDRFATAALQGLLASPVVDQTARVVVMSAWDIAEAMLEERAKRGAK